MPRYKRTSDKVVKVGDRIRLTRRDSDVNRPGNSTVVFTGEVVRIHRSIQTSILDRVGFEGVDAYELPGDVIAHVRSMSGWTCTEIELELPDLPKRAGSVIRIGNRFAVFTSDPGNIQYASDPGWVDDNLDWYWTDALLAGPVAAHDLERAEIIGG